MAETVAQLKARVDAAADWVRRLAQPADVTGQRVIKMYTAFPVALEIPNAVDPGDRLQQLGHERRGSSLAIGRVFRDRPYAEIYRVLAQTLFSDDELWVRFLDKNGNATYEFKLKRRYDAPTDGDIRYQVWFDRKLRPYPGPVKVWFGSTLIHSDINTLNPGPTGIKLNEWVDTSGEGIGTTKYFIRTEALPASKLLGTFDIRDSTSYASDLDTFSLRYWSDTAFDLYGPMYGHGASKPDNYLFDDEMWQDGDYDYGYPADLPSAVNTTWHGFSHQSKVVEDKFTRMFWRLIQTFDPLTLIPSAIHMLNKYNDPNKNAAGHVLLLMGIPTWLARTAQWEFKSMLGNALPWPPIPFTAKKLADWVKDKMYTPGLGVSMSWPIAPFDFLRPLLSSVPWNVPSSSLLNIYLPEGRNIGTSLRTNLFLVLATLLGYKHGISEYQVIADDLVNTLAGTQWGFAPFDPGYGAWEASWSWNGWVSIRRPDGHGSQMFAWKNSDMNPLSLNPDPTTFYVPKLSGLREKLNGSFGQPVDDLEIMSTVETTASFAQALRVYLAYKYNDDYPNDWNIP